MLADVSVVVPGAAGFKLSWVMVYVGHIPYTHFYAICYLTIFPEECVEVED